MKPDFEQILLSHYHKKKQLWGIAPVDVKYTRLAHEAMRDTWNLAIDAAINSAVVKIIKADGIGEAVIVDVESISKLYV